MNFNYVSLSAAMLILCVLAFTGCGDGKSKALSDFSKENSTNVAKIKACFFIFESRKGRTPKNKEELLEFLTGGTVDKNLSRLEVSKDNLEDIFVSERDGEPIKVRWGAKIEAEYTPPIAFETVGVGGVRLVAADTVLEVDNDEEYEELWKGNYTSKVPGSSDQAE